VTRTQTMRRIVRVMGKARARDYRVVGPAVAGWALVKYRPFEGTPHGEDRWVRVQGPAGLRWTMPTAWKDGMDALSSDEMRQLQEEFNK
jgi:hypothetical protein